MALGVLSVVAVALSACAGQAPTSAVQKTDISNVGTVEADASLVALVPEDVKKTGLRVATSAPFAPFEMFDSSQKLEGVDIDLANAVGAKLGLPVIIESVDFAGLIPAIKAGRYNAAIAGMEDTHARQEVFNFIDYNQSGAAAVVPTGNPEGIKTFADLCGRTVGVEQGSTYDVVVENRKKLCADAGKEPVKLSKYPTQSAALLAVRSGAVSALMTSKTTALLLAADGAAEGRFDWVNDPQEPKGYANNPGESLSYSGIGIPKDNEKLFEAFYAAMQKLGEDGTTKKIFEKWHIGDNAVVPPLKNQAVG
ncbi:ABC transporter substrate-binding protein [Arthrobacter bambusae]|uniref:ABC transporter substrate-binding protein n=1 Tax=Arthrobacter bambusae TaxID=1338426 RepID=UPI001F514AF6|nr:ABC transporter substrate-binding protein [Arthrobacter bambusae]MCI0144203.1 ABC transporter substrate-binding protein [Arthrobacter bambusae]